MKKIIKIILLITICTSIFTGCANLSDEDGNITYNYEEVKDILIRFHVIANSDSDEDQNLKLKVRDEIIEYLYPLLKESKSVDESRNILKEQDGQVKKIAEKVIKSNGYSYLVNTELSRENFPDKTYGNITLPQGNYEAYRILIGEASGQNWWCVMFPPLCFIDVTKGSVAENDTKEKMDKEIEQAETTRESDSEEETPKIKFKIVEFFKDLFS